jgi:hypothetical protein
LESVLSVLYPYWSLDSEMTQSYNPDQFLGLIPASPSRAHSVVKPIFGIEHGIVR